MLYYVESKRVLCIDSPDWTCNINVLRTLNKSKLENFKITYLQTRTLIQNYSSIAKLICWNHYGECTETAIEEIINQYLQKAYILTALRCHALMTGN